MSEEITKALTYKRLVQVGFPKDQDSLEAGIVWHKEDSYKKYDQYLTNAFKKASKSLSGQGGTPDFSIRCENKNIIIVIECKEDVNKHQSFENLENYKKTIGSKEDIKSYSINGALHYASFLNHSHDVVAIAVSGTSESNMRITSFVLPQKGGLSDIKLLEDGEYLDTIMSFSDYEKTIDLKIGRKKEESEKIFRELAKFASSCNNFLRSNSISAKDRAGFISALVLALTNEDSTLFTLTEASLPDEKSKKLFKDKIGKDAINLLKSSLNDIWDNKDHLSKMKKDALKEYYDKILTKSLLDVPEGENKYFKYGDTVISCCLFSIFENIVVLLRPHTDLDIMGTFYTVFLKYASGDAKDKGIVLTPKHITDLFCDIAEHFLGRKLNEETRIIDTCTGTGGFLIGALNRMDSNINSLSISKKQKDSRKEFVREHCLIGVEKEPEMFSLAYANMRFHGDGKSNLYSCSSLLKHKGIAGKDINNKNISLSEELKTENIKGRIGKRTIDIGMINPPYSLKSSTKKSQKGEKQNGQSELDFVYSMLCYLKKGGIGIAIVPVSCSGTKGKSLREIILKEHSLLACMSMPKSLFQNSKVGTTTCIMVFKAHIPHNNSSKVVFLGRWLDDGFITIPHQGRYDKDGNWLSKKAEWLRQLKGIAKEKDTMYLRREMEIKEECLAEAYIETDYEMLSNKHFEAQLKKLALFKFAKYKQIELTEKEWLPWLLDNLEEFEEKYKPAMEEGLLLNNTLEWKEINITKLFDLSKGTFYPVDTYTDGEIPLVTAAETNNGIMKMTDLEASFEGNCITVGKVGMSAFYQEFPFSCSHDVTVFKSRHEQFNKYIAMFIIGVLSLEKFRWDYGRQIQLNACKTIDIKLPIMKDSNGEPVLNSELDYIPDYKFMEDFIKQLNYTKSI